MDDSSQNRRTSNSNVGSDRAQRTPYQRQRTHITQAPITDDGLSFRQQVRRSGQDGSPSRPSDKQAGLWDTASGTDIGSTGAMGGTRRYMGVATSDPQYLQPVNSPTGGPAHPRRREPGDGEPPQLHYDRYLQTPSGHKTIFTARQNRARKRAHILVILAVVVALALVTWLLFFR